MLQRIPRMGPKPPLEGICGGISVSDLTNIVIIRIVETEYGVLSAAALVRAFNLCCLKASRLIIEDEYVTALPLFVVDKRKHIDLGEHGKGGIVKYSVYTLFPDNEVINFSHQSRIHERIFIGR
jgi:hypothetical protein